ncbi:MAG: hypothetical protein WC272_07915 [Sulfurimonas sp.]|jgi:hypothetical protein
MANLEQFRKLFNPLPGNHYLHVTTNVDNISFLFDEMMQGVGGKFNLVIYAQENPHAKKPSDANIQYIQDLKQPFRGLPRDHDIVVIKDILNVHQNPKMILKLAYTTLANTANIVIIEKKGVMDIEALKAMLEEHEFRAPNEIDIIEGYDLVMAKKMHMWGAGL